MGTKMGYLRDHWVSGDSSGRKPILVREAPEVVPVVVGPDTRKNLKKQDWNQSEVSDFGLSRKPVVF